MMNDNEESQAEDNNKENPPKPPFEEFSQSIRDALKTGGEDARKAVEENMPKAKESFEKGIHDVAYAVAYVASFGTALAREFAPDPLTEGVREGKEAGRRAADEVVRNRKEREERESRFDSDDDAEPVMV